MEETKEELNGIVAETVMSQSQTPSTSAKSTKSNKSRRSIKSTRAKMDKLDESAIFEIEEVYGPRVECIEPMCPTFIAKLELVCGLGPLPSELLTKSGINSPHTLINTFGGGVMNLAKQLVYMKISLFIEKRDTHLIKRWRKLRRSQMILLQKQ